MQGESNEYMRIFMGGGYRYPLTQSNWLKISAALGVAGGESVDTGGGILFDGEVGIQQKISESE